MNKISSLKVLFGLSTEETAMLLGVSKGQYAMYECGLRSLSSSSTSLVNEMIRHMATLPEPRPLNGPHLLGFLKRELRRNDHQIWLTTQKIEGVQKKLSASARARHLNLLIQEKLKENEKRERPIFNSLIEKSSDYRIENLEVELVGLTVKLETIAQEKSCWSRKLRKLKR